MTTRHRRPAVVRCSGPCGKEVPGRDAHEGLLVWSRTASGEGTMTDASAPIRSNVYICRACLSKREGAHGEHVPELRLLVGDLHAVCLRVVRAFFPKRAQIGETTTGKEQFKKAIEACAPPRAGEEQSA